MLNHNGTAKAATGPLPIAIRTDIVPLYPASGVGTDEQSAIHRTESATSPAEEFPMSSVRFNWQLKAILPVAFVLLAGLLFFTLVTVSLRDPERHAVLMVAGGGAIAICVVSIIGLAHFVQRPMVELQEKIALVSEGNLDVKVSFARRNDEMGDLGRNFNRMMQQLRESRDEIDLLHRTQMSRAEIGRASC